MVMQDVKWFSESMTSFNHNLTNEPLGTIKSSKRKAGFFVHFSAGQFRPKACGALSFEGEKLSFRSKNTSFFHKGSFFVIF